ncbi:tetratricopeptide repeat-containing sensor histidine kinase [Pedobacter arcticus]|uniref:tetratricopeptide repeat-containing sensor histidine kinase n=1 Tax=Pedobacter arcticus TaxID=752140 RepID=UPI0013759D2E|nr:ATP-binding protein [Pedobacter arcticus]
MLKYAFLVFFVPLNGSAFQKTTVKDSLKLHTSLDILTAISAQNVDSIVRFADGLIHDHNKNADAKSLLRINRTTGALLLRYGYLQLAEKYYEDAVAISRKLNDKPAEAENTNSLGVLWAKKGDYVKAEASFLKALLIAKQEDNPELMTASYLKLSTLRIRQNRVDAAYIFCLKADSVNKKYQSHFFEVDLMSNKAVVYAIRGNLKKALGFFKKSYEVAVNEGAKVEQVLGLQNIGLIYKEEKDYKRALAYLNQGLTLAKKSGLRDEELRLSINIPVILVEKNELQLAEDEFLELLTRSKEAGLEDLVLEVYGHLISLAKTQANYKKAFEYLGSSKSIEDKQINEQKQSAFRQASVMLGLYTANKRIIENQNLLFQKNREQNILFGILVFVVILLSFVVFILFRLRKLNTKLNVKRVQLVESNHVKDKLFSIIGHDLRGNQSTTLGILNLIKDGELDDAELELYLGMLVKQSQSALTTLDDLLLWGKAEIKGEAPQRTVFEILPVIQNALDLNSEAIHEKKLNVQNYKLDGLQVFSCSNHFSFIIRNLVANAIKFTPMAGNIKLFAEHHGKDFWKICVADDGIGLTEKELISIFSPGNSSKNGTNNEVGTGLGLVLCKEFVEINDGQIWAERNAEGGTTICFMCKKG